MDYKTEFTKLVEENRLEDARILLERYKIHALEEPFYYANMGWILNHMEHYEEAEIYLKKGIHQYPEDAWIYSQLGFCYDRQGRIEEGLEMMQIALSMGYDEAWIHGEIGWCYKELKDYKKAIQYFENALMEEERSTWVLSQAALAYSACEDYKTAEEYLLRSYHILPSEDAIFDIINFYRNQKEYAKEIPFLEELHDEELTSWKECELGHVYLRLHEFEQAYENLHNALLHGRDDTGLRNDFGDVCMALEKIDEANEHYNQSLSYYEKALLRESDTYWIYQEMIWIAHKQHDTKKKLAYLKRAEKVHKDDVWLMYHYARAYTDLDDYEHAENACCYCIEHGENRKEMLDLYAWNLGRNRKEDKALEVLQERIHKYGIDDWVYGEMGWDYTQKTDYEKALLHFKKALELAPDNLMHISMCGYCLLQEERYEESKTYLDRALSMGRKDGWVYYTYGEVLTALKDIQGAILAYEKALALDYESKSVKAELKSLKQLQLDEKTKQNKKQGV